MRGGGKESIPARGKACAEAPRQETAGTLEVKEEHGVGEKSAEQYSECSTCILSLNHLLGEVILVLSPFAGE